MIRKVEGIDYSVLDAPVGKIFFEPEQKCFDWDADYSLRVMEQLERLEAELEAKKKEFEKALSDAEKAKSKGDFEAARASLATAKSEFPHDERVAKLEEEIAKAEQAAKDAEAAAAAEAERVREAKRNAEQQRRAILVDMLSVFDDLDRAVQAARDAGEDEGPLWDGICLVRDSFIRKLEKHGAQLIVR